MITYQIIITNLETNKIILNSICTILELINYINKYQNKNLSIKILTKWKEIYEL